MFVAIRIVRIEFGLLGGAASQLVDHRLLRQETLARPVRRMRKGALMAAATADFRETDIDGFDFAGGSGLARRPGVAAGRRA